MQWKVSSRLAVITYLFLFSVGDIVVAQLISAPFCTDTTSSWQWSYNSLDQNPCTVAAYLMGTCYPGGFTLYSLVYLGQPYAGPTIEDVQGEKACWCNNVVYNLFSACAECQGGIPLLWSDYDQNCTSILEPSTFPNPVPAGIRVPRWALFNTMGANVWTASTAQTVGDTPEILPGQGIGIVVPPPPTITVINTPPPTVTVVPPERTFLSTSASLPTPGNGLNSGAIVGSVVRGFTEATIASLVSLLLCTLV
ncbi:hypothetical protein EI94DRAFT_1731882 [Lactarius quietus]|nr:hypothetical protein EI94DRAFT_1731882 [Lactarius quietus]